MAWGIYGYDGSDSGEYYEQLVVLTVRVPADREIDAPSLWDWSALCDMDSPDAIEVIAAGEMIGPNKP